MPNERREYPNPPIEEGFCQLVFSEPFSDWSPATPGLLYSKISEEYPVKPEAQDEIETTLNFEADNGGASTVSVNRGNQRVIFKSADLAKLLVVDSHSLSANSLRPYEGWPALRGRLQSALEVLSKVTNRSPITQVNLRYINKIVVKKPHLNTDDYFHVQVRTAAGGEAGFTNFLQRVQSVLPDNMTTVISTFATLPAPPGEWHFLLDLDFQRRGLHVDEIGAALDVADSVKEAENAEFESWITDETRRLFE